MSAVHSNPVTQQGYLMIPNAIALRSDLSLGAKIVYGYLSHLAWKNSGAEVAPAQETIAADLKIGAKPTMNYLRELCSAPAEEGDASEEAELLVTSTRRGQGRPNLYTINDPRLPRTVDSTVLELPERQDPARAQDDRKPSANNKASTEANASVEAVPTRAIAKRKRNLVYDALAEACEYRPQLLDPASPIYDRDLAGEIGTAQASIRAKARGLPEEALVEEVALRARAYRERWPEIDLTPSALAKHWNRVVIPNARSQREEEIRRWAAGE